MHKAANCKQILNYFQVPAGKAMHKQTNTNKQIQNIGKTTTGICVANFENENVPNDQWECLCTCSRLGSQEFGVQFWAQK